jgi:predicted RNA-binding Zn ribbon-like protein
MAGSRFPAYPKKTHKSGQARIKIKGHTYYLGRFNSQASLEEYARLATEHAAGRLTVPAPNRVSRSLTVRELVARWLVHLREEMKDRRERENYKSPLKAAA